MFVRPIIQIDVPNRPEDMARRLHNRFVKDAIRETLQDHHRLHTKKHFAERNRYRYAHAARQRRYITYKRRRWGNTVDLVKTGRSSAKFPTKRFKSASAAPPRAVRRACKAATDCASPGGAEPAPAPKRQTPSARQMTLELARWEDSENRWAAEQFSRRYWEKGGKPPFPPQAAANAASITTHATEGDHDQHNPLQRLYAPRSSAARRTT